MTDEGLELLTPTECCELLSRGGLGRVGEARVLPLHGTLDAEAQDEALRPGGARKVILATNVAETSLTVERVHRRQCDRISEMSRHQRVSGLRF